MKANRFLTALFLCVSLLTGSAAHASQASCQMPTAGPRTMAEVMTSLNNCLSAIFTQNSGASAPSNNPSAGISTYQTWVDTTTNPALVKVYDGSQWIVLGAINTSTHAWSPYIAGAAASTDTGSGAIVRATSPTISAPTISGHPTVEGVTATGATGTGRFVFDGSPTLVTPNIGIASGTSLTLSAGVSAGGGIWALSGTAAPAGGHVAGIQLSSDSGLGFYFGSGAPTISKSRGSIYLRTDGNPYFNTNGTTGWDALVGATSPTISAPTITGHPTIEGVTATGATGTGKIVFDGSPTFVTPTLGVASATSINKVAVTAPATGSTLTIANGKTLTASNTLTFTGTDSSSVAFGAGGTVAYTANNLSAFASTTSSQLAGVLSDETGSGAAVFGTSPTISAPTISGHPTIEGVTAAGATGTGKIVFDGSPTLVTPTLGVAGGTSLALNGCTIGTNALCATGNASLSGSLQIGTDMTIGASSVYAFAGRTLASAPADGRFLLRDSTGATFDRFMLGGTTSSFPAIKRNGSGVDIRVADDTSYAALAAASINKVAVTAPATGSTLTIADGKTLTAANTLTFTGTDSSSVAFGAGGTVAYTANNLSAFAATTSSQLAGVLSDETGSGAAVFGTSPTISAPTITGHATIEGVTATGATGTGKIVFDGSPTFVTPTLGVASAASINKVAITAPATGSTLTIANGKTLTASNTLTFTGTDSSSVAFGAGGTVAYTANNLSAFASTTSSQLAGVLSDETGSGAAVFATSPTIASPTFSGTVAGANTIPHSILAQGGAATLFGNPTSSSANVGAFTIQGLTGRGTPDGANDKLPIYDAADGTIKYVTPNEIASAAVAGVASFNGRTGAVTPAQGDYSANLIPGTTTNDDATAGNIGEYAASGAKGGSQSTVTVTIASPAVVTWTNHGLSTGMAVHFLSTTGALPTGLLTGINYYVIKIDNDTFWLATTAANAIAGTKISTSGSQSGTHTMHGTANAPSGAPETVNVLRLSAGDWDVWGQVAYGGDAAATLGVAVAEINLSEDTLNQVPGTFDKWSGYDSTGTAVKPFTNSSGFTLSPTQRRVSLSAPANVYLITFTTQSGGAVRVGGALYARRAR